mmetsp:Transcript_114929/g.324824  ORF Transcript_114929/g.324824 Transcript_114929/m.324824 type:complete len:219 (+) Transcript_114929:192-848(+)
MDLNKACCPTQRGQRLFFAPTYASPNDASALRLVRGPAQALHKFGFGKATRSRPFLSRHVSGVRRRWQRYEASPGDATHRCTSVVRALAERDLGARKPPSVEVRRRRARRATARHLGRRGRSRRQGSAGRHRRARGHRSEHRRRRPCVVHNRIVVAVEPPSHTVASASIPPLASTANKSRAAMLWRQALETERPCQQAMPTESACPLHWLRRRLRLQR